MRAYVFACIISVVFAGTTTTPTTTNPTTTTPTTRVPTTTTPTTTTATTATATTAVVHTDQVVKKFKEVVRQTTANLFDKADSNHNKQFDKNDMNHIFVDYDINKDGKVSEKEFTSGFSSTNVTIIGKGLFLELDMDKNGFITDSDLPLYFNKIDQNKDGKVSKIEFEDYFTELFTILYVLQIKTGAGHVG